MSKLITARQQYKCEVCKKKITRGQKYIRSTKSIGSPSKTTYDGRSYVMHGIQWTITLHPDCRKNEEELRK